VIAEPARHASGTRNKRTWMAIGRSFWRHIDVVGSLGDLPDGKGELAILTTGGRIRLRIVVTQFL
jgi:hypothetical protein